MRDETVFRLVLFAGFAGLVTIGLHHRLRADTGEQLDRRQEGLVILFGLRLVALIGFLALIVWMVYPRGLAWSSLPVATPLRWLGVLIWGLSLILKTWTFQSLGRNLTDTVVTRRQHDLVTSGPYRWIRHPFYTSFALDVAGIGLLTANGFILLTGVIVLGFLVLRTRREEELLIARFGDEYRQYMERVGRFWPSV